jgi:hypothetical protein
MSHQQHIHEVNDFFRSLTKEQMTTLHTLLGHILEGTQEDNERGAYYVGRLSEHLMIKHGVCICGVDHDAEAKEMLSKQTTGEEVTPSDIAKNYTKGWIRDANAPSMPRSEALKILEDKIGWLGHAEGWSEIEITNAKLDAANMLDDLVYSHNQAAPTPAEDAPTAESKDEQNLKAYHVLRVPVSNEVVCATPNCGRRWMNLEDRMLGKPGKGGCDFCCQREKWG